MQPQQIIDQQEALLTPDTLKLVRSAYANACEPQERELDYFSFLGGFLYGWTAGSRGHLEVLFVEKDAV